MDFNGCKDFLMETAKTLLTTDSPSGFTRRAVEAAESAAVDPMFPDMDPDQAWRRAGEDAQRARALEKRAGTGLRAVGILFLSLIHI